MANEFPKPGLVLAADWSTGEGKRWMARAELQPGGAYLVFPPEPVGEVTTLVRRIAAQCPPNGTALLGFDFPIGLSEAYARSVGLPDFREALPQLGTGPWADFYHVSDLPSRHQPFYPRSAGAKGAHSPKTLIHALGMEGPPDLMRRCDRLAGAAPLFYTLGGKQVGRAAIVGWRDVLAPSLNQLKIWPFAGELSALLRAPGMVAAEVYPAAGYVHLGLPLGQGSGKSKRNRADRQACAEGLLRATSSCIKISDAARSWISYGFLADDDFDAMVALLSMLSVLKGRLPACSPPDEAVRRIEGWILGLAPNNALGGHD